MTQNISKLNRKLRYLVQKIPQEVIRDLKDIEIADRQYTRLRKKYENLLVASVLSFCASFLLMFIPPLGIVVLIGSIVGIVFCYNRSAKYGYLEVEPYRYLIANKLVHLLQRDMPEQNNLKIDLDFSKSIIPNKLISEAPHPLRSGWKLRTYQDSWLNIQGELCDRTGFKLDIIEHHRNASGVKRGSSGKRKRKSKNKFKGSEVTLQLRYPAKKYGAIQVLQEDALAAIKLPNYARVKNFKLNNKLILLKVKLTNNFASQASANNNSRILAEQKIDTMYATITAMFLSLYQILNLAKTLSKVSQSS